ncbi:MAG: multidrug effflux MFS transporter [Pseudomonadota bacterium]
MTAAHPTAKPRFDYLIIVAFVMAIGAFGTDMMLPGISAISRDFGLESSADAHQMVTLFFLGMAAGQIFAGPLSDMLGRKTVILWGYGIFSVATVATILTNDWTVMLVARVVQGLAAAAPRVVVIAMVRDEYGGRSMAQIMSVVGAVFIIVPVFAPLIGQAFIFVGGWRASFLGLLLLALMTAVWFGVRLPETLPKGARTPFSFAALWMGLREVLKSRIAVGYTVAMGFIFGLLVAYLGTAQQVFETAYGITDMFAVYFGLGAISVGVASVINARLVVRVGMRRLSAQAAAFMAVVGAAFAAWVLIVPVPAFWLFMIWLIISFFPIGVLFANLNALAMEPLGHIAGLGAAFVGAISTFLSLPLAAVVSAQFDGTVRPIVIGFAVFSVTAWALIIWTNRVDPP